MSMAELLVNINMRPSTPNQRHQSNVYESVVNFIPKKVRAVCAKRCRLWIANSFSAIKTSYAELSNQLLSDIIPTIVIIRVRSTNILYFVGSLQQC